MITALALLGYAFVVAVVGPRLLRTGTWADRGPRLAIAAWQALTATIITSVVLAGLALTFPTVPVSADLAALLEACVAAIRAQYASPGGAVAGATGLVVAAVILARAGWCLGAALTSAARERARHGRVLDVVGRADRRHGIIVLDADERAAYCLPGRQPRTVVTTGALRALDDVQLDAVLAHERAHLAERHDLIRSAARAIASAFPGVAAFRIAATEIARLIELRADDAAATRSGRLTVAGALLALASGTGLSPSAALAAGGSGTAARVRRLIPPPRPLRRRHTTATSTAVALLLAIPVVVLGGPAVAAAGHSICPDASVTASARQAWR